MGDLVGTRMRPPLNAGNEALKSGAGHGQSPDHRVEPSLSGRMETRFAKMTARENTPRLLHARLPAGEERLANLRVAIAKHPIEAIRPLRIDWKQIQ